MTRKVVVIGAGLAGLQTAFFLKREGMDVTVVERREGPALETSFANGGLITPSHSAPWNSPGIFKVLLSSIGNPSSAIYVKTSAIPQYIRWGLSFVRNSTPSRFRQTIQRNARLSHYALDQYDALRETLNPPMDRGGLGTIMMYRDSASFRNAEIANGIVGSAGVDVTTCSPADLVRLEPALTDIKDRLAGGFYYKDDQHGDAHQFCASLSDHLSAEGAGLCYGETVTDIELSGDMISAVITDKTRHAADAVVLAAGFWSAALGQKLGLRLPIKPVKGYSVTYDVTGWNGAPKIPVVDDAQHIGLTPLGDRIRFVGSAEFGGYSPEINPARIENLRRAAFATYPSVRELVEGAEPLTTWCGHRPMTPDCLPIIGQQGPRNLYLNTGHGYLGWTTASGTSRAVSDLIAGRLPALPVSDYGPDRF